MNFDPKKNGIFVPGRYVYKVEDGKHYLYLSDPVRRPSHTQTSAHPLTKDVWERFSWYSNSSPRLLSGWFAFASEEHPNEILDQHWTKL